MSANVSTQNLKPLERDRLKYLETVVRTNLDAFIKAGEALLAIRDERLYRETHATFEDYCQRRWSMTARHANQLIAGAEVRTMVPIQNERQARELAPLIDDPESVKAVYAEAKRKAEADEKKVTAKLIKEAKAEVRGVPPPSDADWIDRRLTALENEVAERPNLSQKERERFGDRIAALHTVLTRRLFVVEQERKKEPGS